MKQVSIIIPNTNSPHIADIVRSIKAQTVDLSQVEVLVVGVDALELVVEDDLVRFIPTTAPGYASDKRNLGMQLAEGEIVCFIDDDCFPQPDRLATLLRQHHRGQMVVGGAINFKPRPYLQLVDNVSAFHDLLPFTPAGERTYLCTSNLSVNRTVVDQAGLMLPHKNRAEDLEWTVRFRSLGYTLYFEPKAVVWHNPRRYTPRSVWQHWTGDAPDTIRVRLYYATLLQTPALAHYRPLFLWGSPFVALWATLRTFTHRQTRQHYWHTLPLVYLTKLAWCWSAFTHFPKHKESLL